MKNISRIFLLTALGSLASTASAADPYKVRIPTPSDDVQGAMLYLTNYDTGAGIDSVLIDGPEVVFEGEIEEPALVRMMLDGQRAGTFILENGSIVWSPERRSAFGSPLNDSLNEFFNEVESLSKQITPSTSIADRDSVFARYERLIVKTIDENADNPIGYYLFIQEAGQLSEADFDQYLAKYPSLARYKRVENLKGMMEARNATQPGHKYVDFSITQPDGKILSLSEFVKPGKYTLVDFWASWCRPCIQEIDVLKTLWNQYHSSGELDIVGVAVWDEPQNTLAAISEHQIPWPCIINAQTIPTDLYGISGIPCIILIGPDGTILSRDKQDADLVSDVMNALRSK